MVIDNFKLYFSDIAENYFPNINLEFEDYIIHYKSLNEVNTLYLYCSFHKVNGMRKFSFHTKKRLSVLLQFYHKYYTFDESGFGKSNQEMTNLRIGHSIFFKASNLIDSDFEVKSYHYRFRPSEKEIKKLVKMLKHDLETYIMPTYEKLYNVHHLDKVVNTPYDFHIKDDLANLLCGNLHLDKMIIARLAGNPDYERICEFIFSWTKDMFNAAHPDDRKSARILFTIAHDIYDQLKSVEPLKDPNLNNYEIDYDMEPVHFDDEGRFV